MKTKNDVEKELNKWKHLIETNDLFKYIAYGAMAIGGIWVLGKTAKILADSTRNFKELHNAIKQ